MTFIPVGVYDLDAKFLGYAIKGEHKLQSTNLYIEGEEEQLREQLARLNADVDLRQHWPNPKDPEVLALLDDASFMPIEYVETEVVDEEKSHYVYKQIARVGLEKEAFGQSWVDGDEIDQDASVIVYKKAMVPKRPTDVMWRIKGACEQVARKRAGLL